MLADFTGWLKGTSLSSLKRIYTPFKWVPKVADWDECNSQIKWACHYKTYFVLFSWTYLIFHLGQFIFLTRSNTSFILFSFICFFVLLKTNKCYTTWNVTKRSVTTYEMGQNKLYDIIGNVTKNEMWLRIIFNQKLSFFGIHCFFLFFFKETRTIFFFSFCLKTPAYVEFMTKSMSIVMLASCQKFILTVGIYLNTVWAAVINQILERISRFSEIGSVKLASNFAPNVHRQPRKPSL